MPRELPGFYYDAEKNRYFPIKGPIPGTSRSRSNLASTADQKQHSKATQATKSSRTGERTSKLLQVRELNGNVLSLSKGKCNFKEEFQKRLASKPVVWKYQGTNKIVDAALEQLRVNVHTPVGQIETDVLLAGSENGSLSVFEVGKVGQQFDNGVKFIPDRVWPHIKEDKAESYKMPEHIWRPDGASILMSSSITCIKLPRKHSPCTTDDGSNCQHAVITTLGSETAGGSIYVLNLDDPIDFSPRISIIRQRIHRVASINCTIWSVDCDSNASQAVIGTNRGASMVNLETGMASWVCHSESDVLAQQINQTGNVVLCGFRNGAIVTVDVRERQQGSSARLIRHRIPYSPSQKTGQNSRKKWFELSGNICPRTIFMPSSISCLVSLHFYDQYFLASAMDGSNTVCGMYYVDWTRNLSDNHKVHHKNNVKVKLYDHRLTQRGPVQSYEGHANSHTRIQLAVNQSERFVMSGGEDCNLRLWSIKSGELLFEDKFSNSVPSTVCWQRVQRFMGMEDGKQSHLQESELGQSHGWKAWVGTQEGLYHMHWSS